VQLNERCKINNNNNNNNNIIITINSNIFLIGVQSFFFEYVRVEGGWGWAEGKNLTEIL